MFIGYLFLDDEPTEGQLIEVTNLKGDILNAVEEELGVKGDHVSVRKPDMIEIDCTCEIMREYRRAWFVFKEVK